MKPKWPIFVSCSVTTESDYVKRLCYCWSIIFFIYCIILGHGNIIVAFFLPQVGRISLIPQIYLLSLGRRSCDICCSTAIIKPRQRNQQSWKSWEICRRFAFVVFSKWETLAITLILVMIKSQQMYYWEFASNTTYIWLRLKNPPYKTGITHTLNIFATSCPLWTFC